MGGLWATTPTRSFEKDPRRRSWPKDGGRGSIAAQGLLVLGGLRKQGGVGNGPEANTQNQEAFLLDHFGYDWGSLPKKRAIPAESRRALAARHGVEPGKSKKAKCTKCKRIGIIVWHKLTSGKPSSRVTFSGLEIDHIKPHSKGGSHSPENLQLLCGKCNRLKGDK